MRDRDVRPILKQCVQNELHDVAIFDEMPLCRTARADVAAVNCSLWGYEIKSESDSLQRLPLQVPYYDAIFHFSVAVVANRHLASTRKLIPAHWGITVIESRECGISLRPVRKPRRNNKTSVPALVRLLWKTEILKALRSAGQSVKPTDSVSDLWSCLESFPRKAITPIVMEALKRRFIRQAGEPHALDDGSLPIEAIA
jgi:hypothetical protein